MAVNPMGFQSPFDFGIPQFITCLVSSNVAAVSGGQIAYLESGATLVVSSGLSSYVSSDLVTAAPASGANYPVGVIVQNAVSGTYVSVMVKGVAILPASTAVVAGEGVAAINGANAVDVFTSGTAVTSLQCHQKLGRALSTAASGTTNFVLVHVGGF